MIRDIQKSALDRVDELVVTILAQQSGCRIVALAKALNMSEGTIRYRLLTLEARGIVRAVRERGSTTYFLNNRELHL